MLTLRQNSYLRGKGRKALHGAGNAWMWDGAVPQGFSRRPLYDTTLNQTTALPGRPVAYLLRQDRTTSGANHIMAARVRTTGTQSAT